MPNNQLRIFTYFILAYMLVAFGWWSVLLYTKNNDAFEAKAHLMHIRMVAKGMVESPLEFYTSNQYQNLRKQYRRQELMIMGETLFLVFTLFGGMYIVYRSYQQEVRNSNQQRNFLLSITHELKSPIASVRLIMETLLKRGSSLSEKQLTQLTTSGVQESERLNNLVENLLLSAKLESVYQIQKEETNLIELVETVTQRLQKQYPEAVISVDMTNSDLMIKGDQAGLFAVIQNLVENALKYSPVPAIVNISIQPSDKNTLSLIIEDQGLGIAKDEKDRILQKFYRVGNEDTRKTKGTGLGLFIVNEIVRAHQGKITITDNQPKGSIFTVQLPVE